MNAPLKPNRRNRLHSASEGGKVILRQRHRNALGTVRPSPAIAFNATNKPFAKTINLA
jgi:hypothetical protein